MQQMADVAGRLDQGDQVAISWRVSGIMPGGGGWACPAAAATVSRASASMATVAHRYQNVQRRT